MHATIMKVQFLSRNTQTNKKIGVRVQINEIAGK